MERKIKLSRIKNKILEEIKSEFEVSEIKIIESKMKGKRKYFEINFDELIKDTKDFEDKSLEYKEKDIKYKPFALTPFIVHDIACWVNESVNEEEIEKL